MRIVVDTNVLISAFIHRSTPPGYVLDTLGAGDSFPLYDARILNEYRRVVFYRKLQGRLNPDQVLEAIEDLETIGEWIVTQGVILPCSMPDPKDMPFAEVALAGRADAIVTGNRKHFPAALGVRVLSPAEYLSFLQS